MATFSFVRWWWWASSAAVFVSRTLRLHRSARYNTLDCQKAGFQYTVAARRKLMALLCSAVDGGIHFADETRKPQQKTGGTPPLVRFRLIRAVDARPCLFSWCASCSVAEKILCRFSKSMLLAYSYYSFLFLLHPIPTLHRSFVRSFSAFLEEFENIQAHRHRRLVWLRFDLGLAGLIRDDDSVCLACLFDTKRVFKKSAPSIQLLIQCPCVLVHL